MCGNPMKTGNFSQIICTRANHITCIYIFVRNHPKTVIHRFISAFVMLFVAPVIVYMTLKYISPEVIFLKHKPCLKIKKNKLYLGRN